MLFFHAKEYSTLYCTLLVQFVHFIFLWCSNIANISRVHEMLYPWFTVFTIQKVIQSFVFDLSIKNKSNGLSSPYHVVVAILLVMGGENWSNLIPSRKGWHLACALYFSDVTCVARAWGRETLGLKSVKCPTMGGKNGPWGLIDYTTIDQHSASCQNYTMLCWFWGCIDNVEVQSLATFK